MSSAANEPGSNKQTTGSDSPPPAGPDEVDDDALQTALIQSLDNVGDVTPPQVRVESRRRPFKYPCPHASAHISKVVISAVCWQRNVDADPEMLNVAATPAPKRKRQHQIVTDSTVPRRAGSATALTGLEMAVRQPQPAQRGEDDAQRGPSGTPLTRVAMMIMALAVRCWR